ncbi:hypothetical protein U2F26_28950 [Micromonospora sp. 4G57]|uniref:Uncharacterized protein n=1 Tax=Micromonospora sicca TaxID=2202420 RepID=A0ABU5JL75_9ACTN|nr:MULTISPECIES: hypothetical protein [unclassified Micromonospora]MDZ5446706.1 hypothetical protein [Micromonospora sp. 4G57]MDZ5493358.1 hypothetical protein [Micromonospora sp. 4G53]
MPRWTRPLLRGAGRCGLALAGTVAVCAAGTAVVVAFTWRADRAAAVAGSFAAVASTIGVLAAIYLSRQALSRTDRQLTETRRALVLSRYPLLLPIHQSVAFPDSGGMLAQHPPAQERFALTSAPAPAYAFLAITKDRFVVPVENVGEGPALRIRGTLWCSDGRNGPVAGVPALGVGRTGVLAAVLHADGRPLPEEFGSMTASDDGPSVAYWLDLDYADVFANPRRTTALFDPSGIGAWHYVQGHEPGTL